MNKKFISSSNYSTCNLGNVHPLAAIILKNYWLWHHLNEIILYLNRE
jgi:hypothetical protein